MKWGYYLRSIPMLRVRWKLNAYTIVFYKKKIISRTIHDQFLNLKFYITLSLIAKYSEIFFQNNDQI